VENDNDHCKAGEGLRSVIDGSVHNSMHNHRCSSKTHIAALM